MLLRPGRSQFRRMYHPKIADSRLCFALESAKSLRIVSYIVGEELECDEATQFLSRVGMSGHPVGDRSDVQ